MVSVHSTVSVNRRDEREFLDLESNRRPVFSDSPSSVATVPFSHVNTSPASEQPGSITPPDSEQPGSSTPPGSEWSGMSTPASPKQPGIRRRSTREIPSMDYSIVNSYSELLGDSVRSEAWKSGLPGARKRRSQCASSANQSRRRRKSDCASSGLSSHQFKPSTTNDESSTSKHDDTSPHALLNPFRSQRTGRLLAPGISHVPASHFPPDPEGVDTASSSLGHGTSQSVRREVQCLLSQIDSPADTETDDTSSDASLEQTDNSSRILRPIILRLAPEKLRKIRDG